MIRLRRRRVSSAVINLNRHFKPFLVLVSLCAALALAACGSSGATSSSHSTSTSTTATSSAAAPAAGAGAPSKGSKAVQISGYAFHPTALTVAAGTKVTFTNHDQTAHTATQQGGGFDTGTINPGGHATITLTKPGTYKYYCQFHAFMHGTITVK